MDDRVGKPGSVDDPKAVPVAGLRRPGEGAGYTDDAELTERSYRLYFQSGHYDRRYPGPNTTTWRRIRALLPPEAHVIDYGCGSGRYLLPLRGHVAQAAGFDISRTALDIVAARAARMGWHDLAILGPEVRDLDVHIARRGAADLVICLFGVLGHIADKGARQAALRQMHKALKPGQGWLLISVPNAARRFRAEQRRLGAKQGLIHYTREMDGTTVTLPYQLYDIPRLKAELTEAGFTMTRVRAESVFAESWLLRFAPVRWLDRLLTPICPASLGYGLLAEAEP